MFSISYISAFNHQLHLYEEEEDDGITVGNITISAQIVQDVPWLTGDYVMMWVKMICRITMENFIWENTLDSYPHMWLAGGDSLMYHIVRILRQIA